MALIIASEPESIKQILEESLLKIEERIPALINEAILNCFAKKTTRKAFYESLKNQDRMDVDQAVEFLNCIGYKCSKSQIYKKTQAGYIPHIKCGSSNNYLKSELLIWVEVLEKGDVDRAALMDLLSKSAKRKKI